MQRQLASLFEYCQGLTHLAKKQLRNGELLIKVLTKNDDSGRHGVLIPSEGYEFFPELVIPDKSANATRHFDGFDCLAVAPQQLAYKYYQRYPERRITCVNGAFSDRENGFRVAVFLKAQHSDGTRGYYTDLFREKVDSDFVTACQLLFGSTLTLAEGLFLATSIDAPSFEPDDALIDLLGQFDDISEQGWITSLRTGDTGIGYTFETLIGIKENNDKRADFRGIEIKCKQMKEGATRGGKINLFQQAPVWENKLSGIDRLRLIGAPDETGLYRCYSQVSTNPNNLDLLLAPDATPEQIDLLKTQSRLGHWPHGLLSERLQEKHARAVFVKAKVSQVAGQQRFHYKELIYCERPSIERFNDLVKDKRIVFEFIMSEKSNGSVRNHGYPWRLSSDEFLSELFSLRVKLR